MLNKTWSVEVGSLSKNQLLLRLSQHKINLNAYATMLFMSESFTVSVQRKCVNVVQVSAKQLGFADGALYSDIMYAAKGIGLVPCSLELAPFLRLAYLEQSDEKMLTVASARAFCDESYPNGFYLSYKNGEHWLRGYRSTSDWIWPPESIFAFVEGGV